MFEPLEPLRPRYVADLFLPLHHELIALLRTLTPDQWSRPTVARDWSVRDVAAHLLDVELRKLSGHRDAHRMKSGAPPRTYDDVLTMINDANATGVGYARRLSPRLLTDLLEITGPWVAAFVEGLDPHAAAIASVAWAGESQSENWMDTGREYTEWWHHQMQIRDAVGAPPLFEARWLEPLLDFAVRALPRAYASSSAADGASITIHFEGDLSLSWTLVRSASVWQLFRGTAAGAAATARMSPSTAWRLFFNALPQDEARDLIAVRGDPSLAEPLLSARSVMV